MIHIGKPYIDRQNGWSYLCAEITIDGEKNTAWFAVESQFEKYLTVERADAFVVSFLTTAMRKRENIVSEAPLTKRLKYQLSQYLIPAMAANMEIYNSIELIAPTDDTPLGCEGAVATGWTGGADCMFTLMHHIDPVEKSKKLTHLLVAGNGAIEGDNTRKALIKMVDNAKNTVGKDYGLSVIGIDSNTDLLQDENYLAVAGFRLPAVVLAAQKLFGVFYNSATYEFSKFSFVQENSAYYELLLMQCFETDCTTFYSSGGSTLRIYKLKELANFEPARKYLHPCIYPGGKNCGTCGKCVRTQAALYSLGVLDRFGEVFDLELFEKNKDDIFMQILAKRNSQHYGEVLYMMKKNKIDFPETVERKSRIISTAMKVVKNNREFLKEKM